MGIYFFCFEFWIVFILDCWPSSFYSRQLMDNITIKFRFSFTLFQEENCAIYHFLAHASWNKLKQQLTSAINAWLAGCCRIKPETEIMRPSVWLYNPRPLGKENRNGWPNKGLKNLKETVNKGVVFRFVALFYTLTMEMHQCWDPLFFKMSFLGYAEWFTRN